MRRGCREKHPGLAGCGRVRRLRRRAGQLQSAQGVHGQQTPAGGPIVSRPDNPHAAAGRAFAHAAFALQVQKGRHVFHADAMGLAVPIHSGKQAQMIITGRPRGGIGQRIQIALQQFTHSHTRRRPRGPATFRPTDDLALPFVEIRLGALKGPGLFFLVFAETYDARLVGPGFTVFYNPRLRL